MTANDHRQSDNLVRHAILTVSDGVTHGARQDLSGERLARIMYQFGGNLVQRQAVPDDADSITSVLRDWSRNAQIELILTTGGTGIAPRDVTPQAIRAVIDYDIPGIAELMRGKTIEAAPMAPLSRAIAGVANSTLLIGLPGSPAGAEQMLRAVLPLIPHAIDLVTGRRTGHGHKNGP